MKKKFTAIICIAAIGLATSTPAFASSPAPDPTVVCADALVMSPRLFASTVAGSAIFVVCLPFAALSKSVKSTAHALVVTPAQATFTRPLGDFDYYDQSPETEMAATY